MKGVMIIAALAGLFITSHATGGQDVNSLAPDGLIYEQIHSDKSAGVVSDQRRLVVPAEEWHIGGAPNKITANAQHASSPLAGSIERPITQKDAASTITEQAEQILRAKQLQRQSIDDLEKRRQEAQLRAEIAEALQKCRDAGGCPESAPRPTVTVAPAPSVPLVDSTRMSVQSPQDDNPVSVPSLEGVIGDKGLFVTDHGKLYAQRGSTLPGNFKVIRISLKEAVLDRDGTEYRVALKWDPRQEYGASPLSIGPASATQFNNR